MTVKTGGEVLVEDIEIGDIHYECEYGKNLQVMVLTEPVRNGKGQWSWKSEDCKTEKEIEYLVTEGASHYGPKLYYKPQYMEMKK